MNLKILGHGVITRKFQGYLEKAAVQMTQCSAKLGESVSVAAATVVAVGIAVALVAAVAAAAAVLPVELP